MSYTDIFHDSLKGKDPYFDKRCYKSPVNCVFTVGPRQIKANGVEFTILLMICFENMFRLSTHV